MTFKEWKEQIDALVTAKLGVSVDDLPDWGFMSAYEAGIRSHEAAAEIVEEALEEMGLDSDGYQ